MNLIGFDLNGERLLVRRIPTGFYETVPDILKAIAIQDLENKISFFYSSIMKRMTVNVENNAKLISHIGFAQMLGFELCEIASLDSDIEQTIDNPYVADPCAHYKMLMIYSDIVELQIVGEVLATLLRIVNVDGKDGVVILCDVRPTALLTDLPKILRSIEIVTRTHLGDLTPFECGRSYVKLHFR